MCQGVGSSGQAHATLIPSFITSPSILCHIPFLPILYHSSSQPIFSHIPLTSIPSVLSPTPSFTAYHPILFPMLYHPILHHIPQPPILHSSPNPVLHSSQNPILPQPNPFHTSFPSFHPIPSHLQRCSRRPRVLERNVLGDERLHLRRVAGRARLSVGKSQLPAPAQPLYVPP